MPPGKALSAVPALRRGYETEFLPAALEIAHTPASPTARWTAAAIMAAATTAVIWSAVGRVDIVATAHGRVIPAGMSKVVQPLEAGVIRSILVRDGAHVRAGQALFELDATIPRAEHARIARDLRKEELEAAGLRALYGDLLHGDGLASFAAPAGMPAAEVVEVKAEIAARRDTEAAKLADLDQQIAGVAAQQQENTATLEKLSASLPWLVQKAVLYRQLLNVQFTNRMAWLNAEQALAEGQAALKVQQTREPELGASLGALVAQRRQTTADYAHDVLKDLMDAEAKLGELRQQLVEAQHRAEQTVLILPIDGTVQQLAVHTLGGVVTPAQALLTVVPDDAPVLLEVTVENDDIGFVHPGQEVAVKVGTFDFTRYGLLHGHIVDIGHDRTPEGQPGAGTRPTQEEAQAHDPTAPETGGYTAHVALDTPSLIIDGRRVTLEPGMEVTAEIKTGNRTIFSYILSPFQNISSSGLKER